MSIELPTLYQQFIHKSRYARWIDEKKRRETWSETVDRYVAFMFEGVCSGLIDKDVERVIRDSIFNLDVMPSMRAMMTAGKALRRDNVAGYNCAYVAIDDVRAFDEILYILMCGTGVGYSVESRSTDKLPVVAEEFYDSGTIIAVPDSKIGWATSFRELISLLCAGKVPTWDLSKLRPAGAPLKTFGGRSSGPAPLNDLFHFTVNLFKRSVGRRLRPDEVSDLVCKTAEIVVVGGVRRSALLCLCDLEDRLMRNYKTGDWRKTNPYRALANISAVYNDRPAVSSFMKEWTALYESQSGERGIFNRAGANRLCERIGRKVEGQLGLNPCCFTGDMRLLTDRGYQDFASLSGKRVNIVNSSGEITQGSVWSNGEKRVVKVNFHNRDYNSIVCTPDHRFMLVDGTECSAADLKGQRAMPDLDRDKDEGILVSSIVDAGAAEVFDFTEPETHWGVVEGVVVHNSEILLRSAQFCNLTEVVVRADDNRETLLKKVEAATILGTIQSMLTNFRYLRKKWKNNCEEERLLGVSLTGIMDNETLAGKNDEDLGALLSEMRGHAREVNKKWAAILGTNPSAALTCVKPSGTVSQLVNSSSGIHDRHDEIYIRNVLGDNKDPLTKFLSTIGVPNEPSAYYGDCAVFSFPVRGPKGSGRLTRTARQQLDHWLKYQHHWCDHKPSCTVYIGKDEWFDVAAWLWDNFEHVSGISFLPKDESEHRYSQLPYQDASEEEVATLESKMPLEIDWDAMSKFEQSDLTAGAKTYACSGDKCELVDLV